MASGFFAILDDIASLMDDVAMASKVAANKTVGILGDDLAVNAEKATGFIANRELPVLWAITKGSLLNKLIIIPIMLLLNIFFPIAITYILVLGGFYLAYEGVEKIIEYFFQHAAHKKTNTIKKENNPASEKSKIKSAIATDFILSIEIVIIALSTVLDRALPTQIITVSLIALLATIGVYGIVALIVRMDDAGYFLIDKAKSKGFLSQLGSILVKALPVIIKILGVVGTIALLVVSGGILVHKVKYLHGLLPNVPSLLKELLFGLAAGFLAFVLITAGKTLWKLVKKVV